MFKNVKKEIITIPAQMSFLSQIRDFIGQVGRKFKYSDKLINSFKLVIDEACTNIISHGYDGLEPGPIKLVFESDVEKIRLNIFDEGKSFNPDNADEADIESDWEERRIGGLGLFMIKEMVDEIEYTQTDEGSNLLVLTKNLN